MKNIGIFIFAIFLCFTLTAQNVSTTSDSKSNTTESNHKKSSKEKYEIIKISQEEFAKHYYNYKDSTSVYKGKVPLIVDCYADWCGPCKRLSPILQELNDEYMGKIKIVKINTDENRDLAYTLKISSIPTLLFLVPNKKPVRTMGLLPKEQLKEIIDTYLLKEKDR